MFFKDSFLSSVKVDVSKRYVIGKRN